MQGRCSGTVGWEEGGQEISLLTERGDNTGGWEPSSWRMLQFVGHTLLDYTFTNVGQLARDCQNGVFAHCFAMSNLFSS